MALEVFLVLCADAEAHEDLAHHRLDRLNGIAEIGIVDGNITPANEGQALLAQHAVDDLLDFGAHTGIARHEELADAVLLRLRQVHSELGAFLDEELVRDLHKNAASIAELGIRADGAAMVEVQQDLQRLFDDLVCLAIVQVGDEADAAGVASMQRIEEALGGGQVGIIKIGEHRQFSGSERRGGGSRGRAFEFALRIDLCTRGHCPGLLPTHRLLRSALIADG